MLKTFVAALLYTALMLAAIPAPALDAPGLRDLREGTMRKLEIHDTPRDINTVSITDLDGAVDDLAQYAGKLVIVNLWATWCVPCRVEMPALDALAAEYGDDGLVVLPIATGRNAKRAITEFYKEANITTLPIRLDPKGQLARELGVFGLPGTIVISPEGKEIARMKGDAEWFSQSARAIVDALLAEMPQDE
ncbi:TlpA disulfide reductase family protein [Celeribacter arenosi]|uniref:TlpA disulfide reductase family protein n=1 Tax=Celeribacter arenosi TaxID=792649 RepID=A0ABP7K0J2_9RHOB